MRKVFATILFICFLGQTFSQGWYYLGYLAEKKEFAAKCVNKSRPQMHCNGQCQLMKKIQEKEDRDNGNAPGLKAANKVEEISSKSFFPILFSGILRINLHGPSPLNQGVPVDRSYALLHPPGFIA